MEFTVVGDAVNVASRLEKAARELGFLIVASEDCAKAAGSGCRARFERTVEMHPRGRTMPPCVCLAGTTDLERPTTIEYTGRRSSLVRTRTMVVIGTCREPSG